MFMVVVSLSIVVLTMNQFWKVKKDCCKHCSLPIHVKCVVAFGWKQNNCYYCYHDFMVGEKINVYCYSFEFVTMFEVDD